VLTDAVTRFGHAVVSSIFRFDVNKLVPAGGETPQTAALFAWGRLCIANVERLVAWFIIWPVAHFAMIGVLLALGFKRGPVYALAPVELIPGGMLSCRCHARASHSTAPSACPRPWTRLERSRSSLRRGRSASIGATAFCAAATGRSRSWLSWL
jgi:hypothetical protein